MTFTHDAEGVLVQLVVLLPDGDGVGARRDVHRPLGLPAFGGFPLKLAGRISIEPCLDTQVCSTRVLCVVCRVLMASQCSLVRYLLFLGLGSFLLLVAVLLGGALLLLVLLVVLLLLTLFGWRALRSVVLLGDRM